MPPLKTTAAPSVTVRATSEAIAPVSGVEWRKPSQPNTANKANEIEAKSAIASGAIIPSIESMYWTNGGKSKRALFLGGFT